VGTLASPMLTNFRVAFPAPELSTGLAG